MTDFREGDTLFKDIIRGGFVMKVCRKCGFKGNDSDDFCSKCGNKMDLVDDGYSNVSSTYLRQPEIKVSNFSFIVKLVVGIVALLCFPFYRIAGFACLVYAIAGGIFSLCTCMWYNKLSGFISGFLFFLAACYFNSNILTQLLCVIFMVFEIVAGVKIKKKL